MTSDQDWYVEDDNGKTIGILHSSDIIRIVRDNHRDY